MFIVAAVTSCAAAWDVGDAPRWPESPGEIAVYARPAVDRFVQIDRLSVSIDGGDARLLPSDGHSVSLPVTPGRHRLEVVGAFRRCLMERCNGAWTFFRRAETQVELRGACSGVVRVDVFDESRPLGWPPEAPMIDLRQRTRCDAVDPRESVSAARRAGSSRPSDAPEAGVSVVPDAATGEPSVEIGPASTAPAANPSASPP